MKSKKMMPKNEPKRERWRGKNIILHSHISWANNEYVTELRILNNQQTKCLYENRYTHYTRQSKSTTHQHRKCKSIKIINRRNKEVHEYGLVFSKKYIQQRKMPTMRQKAKWTRKRLRGCY